MENRKVHLSCCDKMKFLLYTSVLVMATASLRAQYFQFSQYNFSAQRINPAAVASSDYASASLLYRNQSTGGGFHLTSNLLNAAYPLIGAGGRRWSGIGLSFMDDRSGHAGIYSTQEAGLSYAVNVNVARGQSISVGFKGLFASRRIDPQGLYTGSQYIEDRGFDRGLSPGEYYGDLAVKFFTFSSGVQWQQLDRQGNRIASLGFSFFDINQPDDAFLDGNNPYPATTVFSASVRTFRSGQLSLVPELLYTRTAGRHVVNPGLVTSYELKRYKEKPSDRIDLITRYVVGRSAIAGLQLHRENFSAGVSYDFPLLLRNVANTGTIEVGIEVRRLVDTRSKSRRTTARRKPQSRKSNVVTRKTSERNASGGAGNTGGSDSVRVSRASTGNDMSSRLRHKQDSVQALARAGDLQHEPLVLEEATLRFGFDFNQSELDESSRSYLDDLARALLDNRQLAVQLTGHTDNIGSARFNLRLSIERAGTIKRELVDRGVDPGRVDVVGKGLTEPLNSNSTDEERAENRRVEMKIYYSD
jgi:type IX secretion system PorP/SprF family membrane protein